VRTRSELGQYAEELVACELERAGFTVLARNARVGRLEIDLVAQRQGLVVFCEVRSRASAAWIDPIHTIDRAKVQRLRQAALGWLRMHRVRAEELRFDAASVVLEGSSPSVTYYEGAF
jgi:putative endonuclease